MVCFWQVQCADKKYNYIYYIDYEVREGVCVWIF